MGKLGGLIAAVIAIFFLVVIAKGIVSLPGTQQQLKDAAFIDDGQLHPEYDGQLAIVCGQLASAGDAYDDELMLTIPSPCAIRYVEMLTDGVDEDGYECLVWKPVRKDESGEWLKERVFADGLRLGAYTLDESLLKLLVPGKNVDRTLFDPGEVEALCTHGITPVEYLGVYYLSEAPRSCFDPCVYDFNYYGFRRVHYRMMQPEKELKYAIAGIADGEVLTRDKDLDTQPIFEGANSRNDVVQQNSLYTILGMVLVGGICIFVLILALRKFL